MVIHKWSSLGVKINLFIVIVRQISFFVSSLLIHQFQFVDAMLFITCNGCCFYQDLNQVLWSIHICCAFKHTHTHTLASSDWVYLISLSMLGCARVCVQRVCSRFFIIYPTQKYHLSNVHFILDKKINAFHRNQDKQQKRWIVSMNE